MRVTKLFCGVAVPILLVTTSLIFTTNRVVRARQDFGKKQVSRQDGGPPQAGVGYAARERNAPQAIKTKLSLLRNRVRAQNLTFTVGYTVAMDRDPKKINGTKRPRGLPAIAKKHNTGVGASASAPTVLTTAQLQLDPNASSLDLRDFNFVSPVQDQGECGDCWIFGSIAALEGNLLMNGGSDIDASEQHVLNCTTKAGGGRLQR